MAAIALAPEWPHTRPQAAATLRQLGRLEEALPLLTEQIERFSPDSPDDVDWDRMVVATLLERWPELHASARRIGFPPQPEDGPIEVEPFELCNLVFSSDPGAPAYLAERVGPVTARVRYLARLGAPQRCGDLVAFEASPLNPRPDDFPEDQPYVNAYPAIAVITPGRFRATLPLDGIHPGDERLTEIAAAIDELGVVLQGFSGDGYQLPDPDGGDATALGFFGGMAVPEETSLKDVHDALTAATADLDHPLFWPQLLREADGLEEALHAQLSAMQRYGVVEEG